MAESTQYTVITENDVSEWEDETGARYHFPKRYLKYLQPGTQVVYYKGKMKDRSFRTNRLSRDPHYFGIATIEEEAFVDPDSDKGDLFVRIQNFTPFEEPVPFRDPDTGDYIETIPQNRRTNYFRDGVRPINAATFNRIILLSGTEDLSGIQGLSNEYGFTSLGGQEGGKRWVFSTRYERNPKLRKEAIQIHGDSCKACGFNFGEVYGDYGKGFIHVHHVRPIADFDGEQSVDPRTDLIPLCPNCHAMVHRKPNNTLSLDELTGLIRKNSKSA